MLIELLVIGKVSAVKETRQSELENFNRYGESIREIVESINEGKKFDSSNVGFFSLFFSLQQILIAIWSCDNKEEFLDVIDDWIYDTDKTLDPYISLLHTRYYQTNPDKSKIRNELKTFLKQHPYCKILRTI